MSRDTGLIIETSSSIAVLVRLLGEVLSSRSPLPLSSWLNDLERDSDFTSSSPALDGLRLSDAGVAA